MSCTNFPSSGLVANVTTHQVGEILYKWTGSVWEAVSPPVDFINNLSLPYEFPLLSDAVSFVGAVAGKVAHIKDRITVGGGGGATWKYVLASSVTTNIFNTIQCTGDSTLALVLSNTSQIIVNKLGTIENALNQADREHNTAVINFAFDNYKNVIFDKIYETQGSMFLKNGLTVKGLNQLNCGVLDQHATEPTFTDSTITNPDSQGNNLWNCNVHELYVRSLNATAFHITPYQCEIKRCRIQANLGSGILFHDGGYQVENNIEGNYFVSCLTGIKAPGGFRGPTDQYIINNYFYSNGISERHIEMSTISGSLYSGNHYYGSSLKEYCQLGEGSNVRLVGEYYEGNNGNARLRLEGGNPNSITITGCDFWQGDGNNTDWEGHQETLIKCSISSGNFFQLGMSGNSFNGGLNGVPIFGFRNGDSTDTGGVGIQFDRSNIISGSYELLANVGAGNVADAAIQSSHPEFYKFQSTQNFGFYGTTGSEIFQEDTGSATSFPSLPQSVFWLTNKLLVVNNVALTTALRFSAGGGTLVTGLNPVPPGARVAITRRGANYFIFKY